MNNNLEIWKDIPSYEGIYQASSFGKIRSLNFKNTHRCLLMNQTIGNDGYLCLNLYKNGIPKIIRVHRIIAKVFVPNPSNKICINHKDGNKKNNHINNLEWCTYSENNYHAYRILNKKAALLGKLGIDNYRSKKTLQFMNSGELVNEWNSQADIERTLGISQG